MEKLGAKQYTPSIEATASQISSMHENANIKRSVIVFGRLMNMYLDLNLYEHIENAKVVCKKDNLEFDNNILVLQNKLGQENPVFVDNYGKNHLMTNKVQNWIPFFEQFKDSNLIVDMRMVEKKLAKEAIGALVELKDSGKTSSDLGCKSGEYFYGSLNHVHKGAKYVIVK